MVMDRETAGSVTGVPRRWNVMGGTAPARCVGVAATKVTEGDGMPCSMCNARSRGVGFAEG